MGSQEQLFIKKLEISGYRSFKQVVWEPGSLNLVVGPNGSGKSNLLRFLALISDTVDGKLAKSITEAGGMVPILWDHQPGAFGWNISFGGCRKIEGRDYGDVTYDLTLHQIGRGSAYRIEQDSMIFWNEPTSKFGSDDNPGYRRDGKGEVVCRFFDGDRIEDIEITDYDKNESLISDLKGPDIKPDLQSWTIHQDIQVGPGSSIRQPTTTQYVTKLEAGGGNLVPVLHTLYTGNRDFKKAIDEGMTAGFGGEYERLEFQPASAQQIQLAVQWKSSSEPHAGQDLSDGTLRFLFLLTLLAHPEPPPLVAVEEPDVGLHPSMLPIIAEYAVAASEKTQLVITSHSPEFLDAFTDCSPTVTLCHWEAGQTQLHMLEGERLQTWLDQYRLGNLFTSGDLEALALPDVDPIDEGEEPFKDLPSEDAALSEAAGESTGGENG